MTARPSTPFWSRLPILLAAALQLSAAVLLLANMVLAATWKQHQIILFDQLRGVTFPEKPRLTPRELASGRYQGMYSRLIGSRVAFYSPAVRLRNQVAYSVFGTSANANIILGRGGELLETAYYDEYCTRDVAAFLPEARRWAAKLREIQDDAERRGQTFLYVVTPSKVAQHPEFLPAGLPCRARDADRTNLVPAWIDIVRAAGIHTVDTVQVLRERQAAYPFILFPQGGTHWNAVGAALATNAIDAALDVIRHDGAFPPFRFRWTMTDAPMEPDTDLAELLNLIWPPVHFPVPIAAPDPSAYVLNPCPALKVVVVGGSFMNQVSDAMARSGCRPLMVEYEYWKITRQAWDVDDYSFHAVDPAERAGDVMSANVLIYEENEQTIARSNHGPALHDFLSRQPGWQGSSS